jgi:hypothetical protein
VGAVVDGMQGPAEAGACAFGVPDAHKPVASAPDKGDGHADASELIGGHPPRADPPHQFAVYTFNEIEKRAERWRHETIARLAGHDL